jgi:hypothetical protein
MKNAILALSLFIGFLVHADEGMWFLMFIERLNQRDMEKLGLQLTAEEIYSINHSSLKDAVVQFNGGCTAELISSQGLVLTNHHCGYDAIAELSSPESNHLQNGFWAESNAEELKPKSLFVRFFVRMDDVSKRILGKVNDQMTEAERDKAIKDEIALIEKEQSEGGKYVVNVRSFFQGNEYYYFVFQDYKDVRLVGTPPSSIGKFGGDTDNWEWPRHTGDFSMFRIYADANGNPADYSQNNVPLTPKVHLKVNITGVNEGDFAMILGFPGRTNRWLPSGGIDQNVKYAYPAWVEASKTAMDAMKIYMDKDEKINLDYASKYARIANYWKNRQGMIAALTKFETAKAKAVNEAAFDQWAQKKKNRKEYGNVISTINTYYAATNEKARHDNYLSNLLRASELGVISRTLGSKLLEFEKSTEKTDELRQPILQAIDDFYSTLSFPVEKDILMNGIWLYVTKAGYKMPASFDSPDAISQRVATILAKTVFSNPEQLRSYVRGEIRIEISKDPLFLLSQELIAHLNATTPEIAQLQADYTRAYRKLVKGLRESGLSEVQYPDANSTMRLTYGTVSALPYDKRNDAKVNFYTTLQGTIDKYKPNDEEFDLPQRLIELNNTRDFGEYADKNGYMPVNFLTNNDITGGNSGSPVLNAKGELIGLAFDGNIEAMAGDVIFDDKLQKTINVDIRYVLFIIDKFSGARHIVDEMTIIR